MSIRRNLKALGRMIFRRPSFRIFFQPRSSFDYQAEVGDGTGSSTVMAPLLWVARTFPEAPPALWKVGEDGVEEPVLKHDLLRLLVRPNPFYSGAILWMATLVDWHVDGNAYWLKIRNRAGALQQLWWVPHWLIAPKGDTENYVSHYEYRPGAGAVEIKPSEVVHFRFGLDGDEPRKGYSPLKSVLREVFTDDEAANFTASLLRNMGVPGLVVSPDASAGALPSDEDVAATKSYVSNMFSGDKRGEPIVMSGPTKVATFGFSPEQLLLKELRRIPEERVTAVLGVPAVVSGLGAGLDRSTFTNMGEAREMAYESNIIPTQRILAEELRFQLLTDYEADPWSWRFGFDLSKVRVLQDDEDKKTRRLDVAIRGGWAMVSEGRRATGLPVDDTHDIFLRPLNVAAVGKDGEPLAPVVPAGERGNGNGGGTPEARDVAREVAREIAEQSA